MDEELFGNQLYEVLGEQPVFPEGNCRISIRGPLTAAQFEQLAAIYQATGRAPEIKRSGAGLTLTYY